MKAILVGDNLTTSKMMRSQSGPLREAGYQLQALDWLAPDPNVMVQRNLNSTHLAGTTLDALRNSIDLVVGGVLEYLQEGCTDRVINPGALGRLRTSMNMA